MENQKYLSVNGRKVLIENEKNVLEVIRKGNIDLPTFCYHSELSIYGACRLCVVDIEGRGVQASCSITPQQGMVVQTNTKEIRTIRKVNLELLLANHDIQCPTCDRSNNCKLQELSSKIGISQSRFKKTNVTYPIDTRSESIIHNPNRCVLCGDCVRMCKEVQTVGAIDFINRGAQTRVAPAFGMSLADVECVNCGQCVTVCPVGALTVKPEMDQVWDDITNPSKTVVVQVAPAVRVALGEQFGAEAGTVSTGKMVNALKLLGFDKIYDTSFAADMTIIEEVHELLERKQNEGQLPLITSCCPSWVKFAEQYYPSLLPNLSSCKSPQQMFGSMAKKFLPEMLKVEKKDLVVVSVMPCTAKKMEAKRPEFINEGIAEVDHVITTGELAKMIANAGIRFDELLPESFDMPFGFKTGAGILFGNSGGVMEAALRYVYEKITGEVLLNSDFKSVRGEDGLRTIEIDLPYAKLKIAVAHSLGNARKLCEQIKNGKSDIDFIEMMACPGGCVVGGGQPVSFDSNYRKKRTDSLYNCDKQLQLHKSQENPYVIDLYKNKLGEIGGKQAHNLLHTTYKSRKRIADISIDIRNSQSHHVKVSVCVGTNCYVRGSQDILKKLVDYVTQNKLQDIVGFEQQEETVDVVATFCYERCDKSPVVRVNNQSIEKATFAKVKNVINKELEKYRVEMPV